MADLVKALRDEIVSINKELTAKKQNIITLEAELKSQKLLYEVLQEKVDTYERENQNLMNRVSMPYTPDDISNYFNETIDTFNKNVKSDTEQARYIINTMDIDLKAHIYADENGKLKCSSPVPTAGTEESLSSIKISIRAIPK